MQTELAHLVFSVNIQIFSQEYNFNVLLAREWGVGGGQFTRLHENSPSTDSMFLFITFHKGRENSRADRENIVRIRPCLNQQANQIETKPTLRPSSLHPELRGAHTGRRESAAPPAWSTFRPVLRSYRPAAQIQLSLPGSTNQRSESWEILSNEVRGLHSVRG